MVLWEAMHGKNISIIFGLGYSKINLHFIVLKTGSKNNASIRSITFFTKTLWDKIFVLFPFREIFEFVVNKKQSDICNNEFKKICIIKVHYYLLLLMKKNLMKMILMLRPIF